LIFNKKKAENNIIFCLCGVDGITIGDLIPILMFIDKLEKKP